MIQTVETLIIGAGVIGSSVAMHLAKVGMTGIHVIDLDLEGSLSSSELNAGGVRATWVQPINIEMSKLTIDYFSQVADQVGYKPCGYLWLHPEDRWNRALQARDRQLEMGWPVEVWDVAQLRNRVPFLDKTDGIAGAMFAPRDGLINPNLLKNHYRDVARSLGVGFEDRTVLRGVSYENHSPSPIHATCERFEKVMSHETKLEISASESHDLGRAKIEYRAQLIINCAGPWAFRVAQILGYSTSARPVRRQVCIFDGRDVDLTPYGMIVDTSGVYFHPEAMNGLAGFANSDEATGINFEYDGERFFEERIWPALYERSTAFERLKHVTGWAGLYEVSPDECGIIGSVQKGVFEAHSFSGHGVMHSYAAGLVLAEEIVFGRSRTIDSALLSGDRFKTGKLIHENLVI